MRCEGGQPQIPGQAQRGPFAGSGVTFSRPWPSAMCTTDSPHSRGFFMTTSTVRNYIAGEWVAGATTTINRNPSDVSDVIGEYAQADAAQTTAAIAAAKQAFPGWATGSIQERSNILDRAGTEILARKDELGRLLSREEGKTLGEGVGEAMRAGQICAHCLADALAER